MRWCRLPQIRGSVRRSPSRSRARACSPMRVSKQTPARQPEGKPLDAIRVPAAALARPSTLPILWKNTVGIFSAALVWCWRSEEHTSELQSRLHLVCRLLLEKKKKTKKTNIHVSTDDLTKL